MISLKISMKLKHDIYSGAGLKIISSLLCYLSIYYPIFIEYLIRKK